jgi:hypothetical protein
MKVCRSLILAGSVACLFGADGGLTVTGAPGASATASNDTVVFTLPGKPRTVAPPPAAPVAPAAPELPPAPELPKVVLPDAFLTDSSLYLQGVIGAWKKADAEALLGPVVRERPVYDTKGVHGQIFAFHDPSDRYKELELDFDTDTGILRTVFAYPKQLTWQDCRKLWGGEVSATRAKNGRTFYSYLNRKLDVLVDHDGKVISLGLY